ncbi:(2Fe-2S)-binding protein [Alkalilimnicola ehrlichii MLHE-1]|uniref:Bacterioferritin-associated ferredoxin n=1 Tax=Alkalilimnicola ehrlichii (strain ATCC BAA-1101 / DSM 17681 / MLHE-1) TaxID=187272 RepID=Q0ABK4_ALKEH|nr:(2Fe-2S)-binding protein [Alkalilimnicola ehrlichii]ABI55783.1 BFD domain protein (2Fe-2S)-binding domain protein [Alkalilimnicola ehrlichii MLHE-1]
MYVCLCKAITDRDVRQALDEGCYCMRDLKERLGVCSACCKCAPAAKALLNEYMADPSVAALARRVA